MNQWLWYDHLAIGSSSSEKGDLLQQHSLRCSRRRQNTSSFEHRVPREYSRADSKAGIRTVLFSSTGCLWLMRSGRKRKRFWFGCWSMITCPAGARASWSGPAPCKRTCRHGGARFPERGNPSQSQYCNDGSALVIMKMT